MSRRYQPHRDADWRVIEPAAAYITRMQQGPLNHWPAEVLQEWLHRHAGNMEDYAFLGFERMQFTQAQWELAQIPGREAFCDDTFCDSFQNVEVRAAENQYNWLAHYMLKEGTWNTPIVLLENPHPPAAWQERKIKAPYHLLEGHRRLSFLQGLKRLGHARKSHSLWLVHIAQHSASPVSESLAEPC